VLYFRLTWLEPFTVLTLFGMGERTLPFTAVGVLRRMNDPSTYAIVLSMIHESAMRTLQISLFSVYREFETATATSIFSLLEK
jgi:hypothetical protein